MAATRKKGVTKPTATKPRARKTTAKHRKPPRGRRKREAGREQRRRAVELEVSPRSVQQGDPIIVRGLGWAGAPIALRVDGKAARAARVSAGFASGGDIEPDASGELVFEVDTHDLAAGRHRLTVAPRFAARNGAVDLDFTVERRPRWEDVADRRNEGGDDPDDDDDKNGREEPGGREEEGWDAPYWRQLYSFRRRFGHLGFIPEGVRHTQIAEMRRLRALRDRQRGERGPAGPGGPHGPDGAGEPEPSQPVPGVCNWTPVGSGPLVLSPTTAWSGRAISIAFHPTTPSTVYVGTANGGVWKSTDSGQTWSPKSDFQRSLAIGALAIDPNDPQRIFAGTGQYGAALGTYYGNGILRSIDGGNTWTELATTTFQRDEISRLLFDPTDATSQRLFLSSGTGVYATTDGGVNWTLLRAGRASDLVLIVSGANVQIIAGFATSGIWTATRTAGVWSAWTQYTSTAFPTSTFDRIALGQSQGNPQTIYAAFSSGSSIAGMAKTTIGGSAWTFVTPPLSTNVVSGSTFQSSPLHSHSVTIPAADLAAGMAKTYTTGPASAGAAHTHTISVTAAQMQTIAGGLGSATVTTNADATGHSHQFVLDRRVSGQTWYNFHISPHPTDPNTVFYGEVSLWKTTTGDGPWTQLPIMHTDNHAFAFEPGAPNTVWSCCDGGVFRSTDGGTTWAHRNRDLGTLEYISVAQHPQWETVLLAGTQDNGTHRYSGSPAWELSIGGDGGFSAIDPAVPTRMYREYVSTTFHRSDSSGAPGTWVLKNSGITGGSEFYAPFALDPSAPSNCYFGGSVLWRSANNADSWAAVTNALVGNITAIAVHPADPTTVYVGTTVGRVYRVQRTGATWALADVTTTDITATGLPANVYIGDLAVDSAGTVWVTLASVLFSETNGEFTNDHVYRRLVGGTTWENRSTGLAQANPINSIVIDPSNANRLFCAGDVGVFRTENAGATWTAWDEGLPNVAVFDLAIHGPRRLLRAATHGRSIWERPIDTAVCPMVDLYMRDNILDSGRVQPTPEGVVHPFDPTIWVGHWQSEDIKVDAPQPGYQTPSAISDYVAFTALQHRTARRTVTNRFYVQVHNRGVSTAHNVQVRAFFAAAAAGLPTLPADFWSAGKPFAGPPSGPDWTAVGPTRVLGDLEPGEPGVAEWDWVVPATAPQHSCLLAVATCTEDPLVGTGVFNPDFLVSNRKQVTLKNLNVADVGSGTAMPPEQAFTVDLRAPSPQELVAELRLNWGTLPRGTRVFLAFAHGADGEPAVHATPAELEQRGITVSRADGALFPEKVADGRGRSVALDRQRVYRLTPGRGRFTVIPAVRLPVRGPLKVALNLILPRRERRTYQFDVMQLSGERVVGGVTYRVRGTAKP